MVSKAIIKEIDRTIKQTWINNIQKDYKSLSMLKEDSLKCCMYYHLRRKLAKILEENNLRIYPEFYFSGLHYRADLVIVEIDPELDEAYLKNMVTEVVAVIELKYVSSSSDETISWVENDILKIKNYIEQGNLRCQYYFAVVYENECDDLNWMDAEENSWAVGHVTELDAGYIKDKMKFEVNSYNGLNSNLY